jgi:hypothetical protein
MIRRRIERLLEAEEQLLDGRERAHISLPARFLQEDRLACAAPVASIIHLSVGTRAKIVG